MNFSGIPFQFIGNAVSLDLLNTQVLFEGQLVDLLAERERLAEWLQNVPQAPALDAWSEAEIKSLYALRDSIRNVLKALANKVQAASGDLDTLNAHLAAHCASAKLTQTATGFAIETSVEAVTPRDFLASVASDVARLATQDDTRRLKTCAHPDCVLVFHDTSKSGRRRWCSMETCGNRSKAATFRASHSQS